jgi:hypothetical protein
MTEKVLAREEVELPELPSLEDIEHPVLKRAVKRVQEMLKDDGAKVGHNRHHNRFDKQDSPYW